MNLVKQIVQQVRVRTRTFRWALELYLKSAFIVGRCLLTFGLPALTKRFFSVPAKGPTADRRSLLIIGYHAPPYRSQYGTQRISKFAKFLATIGWRIIFLTTTPIKDYEFDASAEPLPENVEVIRINAMPKHPFYGQGMFAPDDFVFWVPPFERAIARVLSERNVDLMLVTVPPYSVGLAAATMSIRAGVPVVCDFRDPWSQIDSGWVLRSRFMRLVSAALERGVLNASDAVVMVSESRYFTDYFVAGVARLREKVVSIRNGFDDDDFAQTDSVAVVARDPHSQSPFVISYAGVLYSDENVANILRVLTALREKYPDAAQQMTLEYAGPNGAMLTNHGQLPIQLLDHGFLTHRAANAIREKSCVQLFALPSTFRAHVSSGKIFEMIRSGVPILALTRSDGTVAHLIEETRTGSAFEPLDAEAAAESLKQMFDQWRRDGKVAFDPAHDRIKAYSRKNLTGSLSTVLAAVVDRRR